MAEIGQTVDVRIMDSDDVVALIEKFTALIDALKAMQMTCHNCGEKQELSLGVTQAIAALMPSLKKAD